MSDSEDK